LGDHPLSGWLPRWRLSARWLAARVGGGELVVDDSVGVTALRSPCPIVAIPEMTGDVTTVHRRAGSDAAAHGRYRLDHQPAQHVR